MECVVVTRLKSLVLDKTAKVPIFANPTKMGGFSKPPIQIVVSTVCMLPAGGGVYYPL